jgi:5'-nucleotidase
MVMQILLSNDDGYQAEGIVCLANLLKTVAEIHVVAPDRNRSGASNSLTLDNPIRATVAQNGYISVDGTPTDCVHLAITGLLETEPDMVIAGINAGSNLGDDVIYSGTVAAAMEGRFLGFPAFAVSLVGENCTHFATAARVVKDLLKQLEIKPLPKNTLLNINVPDLPWEELEGLEVTRLGRRHKSEPVVKHHDPRGNPIYWVGPVGPEEDAGPGTDFNAVRNNKVSITPIQIDLTNYEAIDNIKTWVSDALSKDKNAL